jgi:ribosome-binding factor A
MAREERVRKVSKRIREEIAILFHQEVEDPRLAGITITDVSVDRELAFATIFFSSLGDEDRIEEIKDALEGAKGFLRSQLAARIPLRSFPRLRFKYDSSPVRGARIEELLRELKEDEEGSRENDL